MKLQQIKLQDIIPILGIAAFAIGIYTYLLSMVLFEQNFVLGICGLILGLGCAGIGGMYLPTIILHSNLEWTDKYCNVMTIQDN